MKYVCVVSVALLVGCGGGGETDCEVQAKQVPAALLVANIALCSSPVVAPEKAQACIEAARERIIQRRLEACPAP